MDDREQQRAAARALPTCVDPATLPLPVQLPRVRDEDCSPPTPGIPEVFYPATGVPEVTTLPPYTVPVVLVGNDAQTVTCADLGGGTVGDSVTVAENALTTPLILEDIPGLTEQQGRYLAILGVDALNAIIGANSAAIVALTLLNPSQADYLVATIVAYKTDLNARAVEIATSEIVCQYGNNSQTATCTTLGYSNYQPTGTYAGMQAISSVTVEANVVLSLISQADADAQALAQAEAGLICVWINTSQTQTCLDLGFTETVPVAAASVSPPYPARVGSYNVPASTVASLISQDDANTQAVALAQAQLACFYINTAQTATCPPDTVSAGHLLPSDPVGATSPVYANSIPVAASIPPADYVGNTPGNPSSVPAGVVISNTSTSDANNDAQVLAQNLLNCYWVSLPQTVVCPDVILGATVSPPFAGVTYPADPTLSSTYTVTVSDIISYVSQEDADTQAYILALAQLDCIYCNKAVAPLCVPDGTVAPVTPNEVGPDWSRDATPGVPAGTYCAADPATAQQIAEQLGSLPIRLSVTTGGDACTYGNDPVKAQCIQQLSSDGTIEFYGLFHTDGSRYNTAGADSATLPTNRLGLSPDSLPDPYSSAFTTIAKDTIIVAAGDVPSDYKGITDVLERCKTFANDQAISLARTYLDCYWDSQPLTVLCGASKIASDPTSGTVGSGTLTYGTGQSNTPNGLESVATRAQGSTALPVQLSAKAFSSGLSQNDANQQALDLGVLQLNCYWISQAVEVFCGGSSSVGSPSTGTPGDLTSTLVYTGAAAATVSLASKGSTSQPIMIELGLFESYVSQEDATQQAFNLARLQLNCFWDSQAIEMFCGGPTDPNAPSSGTIGDITSTLVYTGANAATVSPDSKGSDSQPILINVALFQSNTSQIDANLQAFNLARLQLDCFWDSQPMQVFCGAGADASAPQSGNVGNLSSTLIFEGSSADTVSPHAQGSRALPVILTVGTFQSFVSQGDANQQALDLGLLQLSCFWDSQAIQVLCGAGSNAADPNPDGFGSGPPSSLVYGNGYAVAIVGGNQVRELVSSRSTGSPDNPVSVTAALFQSFSSQLDATQQALDLALLTLDCYWTSIETTESCQPQVLPNDPGNSPYPPSETYSPVFTTTIPASQFTSYVSQEDANNQASTIAQAQLDCLYCNTTIAAQCADGDSLDQTAGINANVVCTPDAETSLAVADAIAAVLVRVQGHNTQSGDCSYGNDPVTAACLQVGDEPSPSVVGLFKSTDGSPYDGTNDATEPDILPAPTIDNYFGLSTSCWPRLGSQLHVAANTITVKASEAPPGTSPKEYANQLARLFARAQLSCFFTNEKRKYYCDGHLNDGGIYEPLCTPGPDSDGYYEFGDGTIFESGSLADLPDIGPKLLQSDVAYLIQPGGSLTKPFVRRAVDPTSTGYKEGCGSTVKNPLIIQPGQFESSISRADLNRQVRAYATSALDCFFRNQPLRILCGADEPVLVADDGYTPLSTEMYYYGDGSGVNPNNDGSLSHFRYASALYPSAGLCQCSPTDFLTFGDAEVGGIIVPPRAIGSTFRPVIVPYGLMVSKASMGDANEQALQTGLTQLRCNTNNLPIWGFGCQGRTIGTMVPVRFFTRKGVLPITASDTDKKFWFDDTVLSPNLIFAGATDDDVSYLINISHHNCFKPGDTINFTLNQDDTKTTTGTILRTFGVLNAPAGAPYYAAIKNTAGVIPMEDDVLDTGEQDFGSGIQIHPFDITIFSNGDAMEATFIPGTGNNLSPDNIFDNIDVPSGVDSFAFLRLYTDGNSVQSCTLMISTTRPKSPKAVQNSRELQVDVLLHLISYKQSSDTSIPDTYTSYRVFFPENNVSIFPALAFQTPVNNLGGPQSAPYDNWYTWIIGST